VLALRVALRFLRFGKAQTVLIIIGISVAISVQVFVGLLIDSLQKGLVDRTVGNSPHVTVTPAEEGAAIPGWDLIVATAEDLPLVQAVGASASGNAFVGDEDGTLPVLVKGVDFEAADSIYGFSESLYAGTAFTSKREVLIGRELSDEIGVGVGDRLTVLKPGGETNTFLVSGLYDLGVASINESWIVTRLETAQRLLGLLGRATSVELSVSDVFAADRVANELEASLASDELEITDWQQENEQLLDALRSQGLSSSIIQVVIIVSVVIAISGILGVTVLQKSRQIGILKAMGIKDRDASLIFVYEGLLLGLVGSLIGVSLGVALLYSFTTFAGSGEEQVITLYFEPAFLLRSWLIAVVASCLAAALPARRSLRLNPIDVIRE
jgi:lipoprotein-releasing system permease protein